MTASTSISSRLSLPLFAFTLFLSAAVMFALQPMVGKMLLPIVGGTPAGWIVAMAFFQTMLLVGYFFAHILSTLAPRAHGIAYVAALLIGAFFLPIHLGQSAPSGETPDAFDIFKLLSVTIAVPFVAISATSSTVQRLFTATEHSASNDPYFLYAASNLGSFAGLFLYPLFIEPRFTLTQQGDYWFAGYGLLAGLALVCIAFAGNKREKTVDVAAPVSWKTKLEWMILSFVPSSLLLGVTSHITMDIISAPMIWVLPLGLYLLTFVIAFGRKQFIPLKLIQNIQPTTVAITVALLTMASSMAAVSWLGMAWHLFAFTVVALMCHIRLAELRPVNNSGQLTAFYLMMSVGGALGGLLNAFIVPVIFTRLIEYPLMMILSCLLNPGFKTPFSGKYIATYFAGVGVILLFGLLEQAGVGIPSMTRYILIAVFLMVSLHPKATLICGLLMFFVVKGMADDKNVRMTARNFYGVIRSYDVDRTHEEKPISLRYMSHGTTTHGVQILDDERKKYITAYFTKDGPLGDVFRIYNPQNVLVMGLGVGTINCYATPEREMTFIEIDPLVVEMAKTEFSYLEDCKGKGETRIIVGDGRLELDKMKDEKFDIIVLDAFSSDMVPTHLLTREAMQLYTERLKEGGVIVFNISNRYFKFESVLGTIAKELGLNAVSALDTKKGAPGYEYASQWVAVTREETRLLSANPWWHKIDVPENSRVWTDEYSSYLGALGMFR